MERPVQRGVSESEREEEVRDRECPCRRVHPLNPKIVVTDFIHSHNQKNPTRLCSVSRPTEFVVLQ